MASLTPASPTRTRFTVLWEKSSKAAACGDDNPDAESHLWNRVGDDGGYRSFYLPGAACGEVQERLHRLEIGTPMVAAAAGRAMDPRNGVVLAACRRLALLELFTGRRLAR